VVVVVVLAGLGQTLLLVTEEMADHRLLVLLLGLQQCIMAVVAVVAVLPELADLAGEQQLQHSKAVAEMAQLLMEMGPLEP
jgi:hypothetical protein